jgi:hypothetical protein
LKKFFGLKPFFSAAFPLPYLVLLIYIHIYILIKKRKDLTKKVHLRRTIFLDKETGVCYTVGVLELYENKGFRAKRRSIPAELLPNFSRKKPELWPNSCKAAPPGCPFMVQYIMTRDEVKPGSGEDEDV